MRVPTWYAQRGKVSGTHLTPIYEGEPRLRPREASSAAAAAPSHRCRDARRRGYGAAPLTRSQEASAAQPVAGVSRPARQAWYLMSSTGFRRLQPGQGCLTAGAEADGDSTHPRAHRSAPTPAIPRTVAALQAGLGWHTPFSTHISPSQETSRFGSPPHSGWRTPYVPIHTQARNSLVDSGRCERATETQGGHASNRGCCTHKPEHRSSEPTIQAGAAPPQSRQHSSGVGT